MLTNYPTGLAQLLHSAIANLYNQFMHFRDLPTEVGLIAEIIGRERALFLAGKTERIWLTIPVRPSPNHKLVQILGMDDALKLSKAYPGWVIKMPGCWCVERDFRHKAMNFLYGQGFTLEAIAEIFSVSRRTVLNVVHYRRIENAV